MTDKPPVSSCCGAPMRVESGDDGDIGNKDSVTNHYVCTACGKPTTPKAEREGELLPCPFCGSEAILKRPNGEYFVQCSRLGCCYGHHDMTREGYLYLKDAVSGWNHRSSPAPTVEQVEKAIEETTLKIESYMASGGFAPQREADRKWIRRTLRCALLPLLTGKKGEK